MSDAEKYRRGRRQDAVATAWDEGRASLADRRRLADVHAAKRARRGEGPDDADAEVRVQEEAVKPQTLDSTGARASTEPAGATLTPSAGERVHVDPVLSLTPQAPTSAHPDEFSILVVCTGNVCRSPYFECVLADELRDLPVAVSGAGTGALLIDRMTSGSAQLLTARGIDPTRFAPRQLTAAMVAGADLVLTATREHRHLVIEEAPGHADTVFSLLDFADVCESAAHPAQHGVDALRAFVREAGARTLERRSRRSEKDAAILDPFRQGLEVFASMAAQSDPALDAVARTIRTILA